MDRRKVKIVWNGKGGGTWFVSYVERKKHGHYCAAGFDARDHQEGDVIAWVNRQPHLELVK